MTVSSPSSPGVSFRRSHPTLDGREPRRRSLPSATPQRVPPRRRPYGRFAAALAWPLVFVAALVVALFVHLDAPSARRAVARLIVDAVARRGGTLTLSIDRISRRTFELREVTLRDAHGQWIAAADHVQLHYDAVTVASTFLRERAAAIDQVVIDHGVIALRGVAAARGIGPASRATLTIRTIDIRSLELLGPVGAHGAVENASLALNPEGLALTAPRIALEAPSLRTSLVVEGSLRVPAEVPPGALPVVVEHAEVRLARAGARANLTVTSDERSYFAHVSAVAPDVAAELDVRGTMQLAEVSGLASVVGGTALFDAHVEVAALTRAPSAAEPRIELGEGMLRLRGIDPAMLGGPSLRLSTELRARAMRTVRGMELAIEGDADAASGRLVLSATTVIAPNHSTTTSGTARAELRGATFDATFRLENRTLDATVVGTVPTLQMLGAKTFGRIELVAATKVELGAKTFVVDARAHVLGVRHSRVAIPDGTLAVRVDGSVAAPRVDARLVAPRVLVSRTALRDVDVRVAGTPRLLELHGRLSAAAEQRVVFSSRLEPNKTGARLAATSVRVERERGFLAELSMRSLTLDGDAVHLEGLRVSSTAGGLRLDASYDRRRHRMSMNAASTPLDVAALLHGLGLEALGLGGIVTVEAKLATIPRRPTHGDESGVLRLAEEPPPTWRASTLPYLTGHMRVGVAGRARLDVNVEDRWVDVDLAVAHGASRVVVRAAAMLDGHLDDPRALVAAAGHVDLWASQLDLRRWSSVLPYELAGYLNLEAHVERHANEPPHAGSLRAETGGLAIGGVTGVDVRLRASLEASLLGALVEARDARGPLAIVHAATPARSLGGELRDLPLAVQLIVLPREVALYPRVLRDALPFDGKLGVFARAAGTLATPHVELHARLETDSELDLTATYDGAVARFATTATAHMKEVLSIDGELRLLAADLLAGGHAPWAASLDAKLANAPLEALFARFGVAGSARGAVHLEATKGAVRADGHVDVERLTLHNAKLGRASFIVHLDEHAGAASAIVRGPDGHIDGTLEWTRGAPIAATLDVKDLRSSVLEPFVPVVDALEGKVDARITAAIAKRPDGRFDAAPVGTITLREGVIVVEALGERWEHVNADLKLDHHRLELPEVELVGRSGGRVKVAGFATLAGVIPRAFHVRVDAARAPFAQRGVKVGVFSGRTELDGKLVPLADGRERLVLDIMLDRLWIDLGPSAEGQPLALDDDPSILTRQPLDHHVSPAGAAGIGMPVTIAVRVREPVLVRRSDVHIAVIGDPKVEIDGPADLGGALRIVGNAANPLIQQSWVEVAGKRFYLHESSLALERREKFDPVIDVDARWLAPDGTIVQVKVTGHLRAPHIAYAALDGKGAPLALTRGQIMSLLALERRDPGSLTIQLAAEMGASLFAIMVVSDVTGALLGKEMQKWLPGRVRVPFAPTSNVQGGNLEHLYLEVASNTSGARLGAQPLGQTMPRRTYSIEWRHRLWSLVTTIGDTGSALVQFMWQRSY